MDDLIRNSDFTSDNSNLNKNAFVRVYDEAKNERVTELNQKQQRQKQIVKKAKEESKKVSQDVVSTVRTPR